MGLVFGGLVACGDDDDNSTPDAPRADAPPDTPGAVFKEYDADEGGEVRIEYVRFGGGNAAIRATAFFYSDPGSTKFFPYLSLNGCTDTSTDMHWPTASNPVAERGYLDPGQVILSGGPNVYNVPRRAMAGNDVPGRPHPADKWFFGFAGGMANDAPMFLPEKTKFDVTITGSADMPGTVFEDVLFMPADFTVTAPTLSLVPHPIPADTAQTFTWTTPDSMPPTGYEIQSLVAFTGANGPAVICVEPNDGSITVPADMINIARSKYPQGGTLARQTLTHVVRELRDRSGPTGKRIDFITVWCVATPFAVP